MCGKYWNSNSSTIEVIGLDRHHKYRVVELETKYIENLRITKVYKPRIYGLMDGKFASFEEQFIRDSWWSNTNEDKKQIEDFISMWNANKYMTK